MASIRPTGPPVLVPQDVLDLILRIFADCNDEVSGALSRDPNIHEETLDHLLIRHLGRITPASAPHSGWIVGVEAHFLGGGRHFRGREIADIGVLVVLRRGHNRIWSKVALFQSKRLFPLHSSGRKLGNLWRLLRQEFGHRDASHTPMQRQRIVEFTLESRYNKLDLKAQQAQSISLYKDASGIPVHYLLYNPAEIPWSRSVPATPGEPGPAHNIIGCRIIRSEQVVELRHHGVRKPTYSDLAKITQPHAYAPFAAGWRLEDFIVALVLGCHEGSVLNDALERTIQFLFYEREYPIAAAFVATLVIDIEIPG